jgi:hypothetical protein
MSCSEDQIQSPQPVTDFSQRQSPFDASSDEAIIGIDAEGSFAVLFDFDQSEFGFNQCGGNGGTAGTKSALTILWSIDKLLV